MNTRSLFGALGLATIAAVALAQTTLWVSSTGAKLKAETRATSATVAELPLGTELTVLGSEDKWYRVSAPEGGTGWIYRGKVSETPPAGPSAGGGGGLFGGLTSSSIEAGAADTSRSIRGLSPEVTEYADSAGTPEDYRRALDRVLAYRVGETELDQFLREGHIGEYAE